MCGHTCMLPGSETHLPNNCPRPLLSYFFFSWEVSFFPSKLYHCRFDRGHKAEKHHPQEENVRGTLHTKRTAITVLNILISPGPFPTLPRSSYKIISSHGSLITEMWSGIGLLTHQGRKFIFTLHVSISSKPSQLPHSLYRLAKEQSRRPLDFLPG